MARSNSFEGGSNGTTITTGNSGGSSGDAFDNAPAPGTGATMTFSTAQAAHGSVSMSTSTSGTSTTAYAGYTLATVASDFVRAYCRFTSLPSAQQVILRYLSSGSQSLRVNVTTAGLVEVRNAANTVVGTTTSAISAGSWFRIELNPTFSTTVGAIALRLYLTPDGTSISDSLNLTSLVLTANATEVRFGVGAAMANAVQVWTDDLAIEGTTWHGPAVRSITPTGIAVAAATGTTAVAQSLSVAPTGIAVGAALGSTALAQPFSLTPTGIAVPVAVGDTTVAQALAVTPTGIAVTAAVGDPAVSYSPPAPAGVLQTGATRLRWRARSTATRWTAGRSRTAWRAGRPRGGAA